MNPDKKFIVEDRYGNVLIGKVTKSFGVVPKDKGTVTTYTKMEVGYRYSNLLTEDEIKGYDEGYWTFAKPVDANNSKLKEENNDSQYYK